MDRFEILRVLRDDVTAAQQRRDEASARFTEVMMHDTPGGIPHPHHTERIHEASRAYSVAQQGATDALMRLNEFLIHGTVPAGMERKPAAKAASVDPHEKTGTR